MPFVGPISGPMISGTEVQVHGRVLPDAEGFVVNLQKGGELSETSTIALHVNPRFPHAGKKKVVLNSRQVTWGPEKIVDGSANPFAPGQSFLLTIKRQKDEFEISVNAKKMATFKHRLLADIVESVSIAGDVIVDLVSVV